jgi:sugar phosphate permease
MVTSVIKNTPVAPRLLATVIYWLNPAGNPGVDMACMIVIGFLIYGPVMLS